MGLRVQAWKHANLQLHVRPTNQGSKVKVAADTDGQIRTHRQWKSTASPAPSVPAPAAAAAPEKTAPEKPAPEKPTDPTAFYRAISVQEKNRMSQERDFLASVFASTPTKRDAKKYIQTFGAGSAGGAHGKTSSFSAAMASPQFVQGPRAEPPSLAAGPPRVAIVKLQDPDTYDDATLAGLAKTFVQLRALGLASLIVVGPPRAAAGAAAWFDRVTSETQRVADAVDNYTGPVTSLVVDGLRLDDQTPVPDRQHARLADSAFVPGRLHVDADGGDGGILRPLARGDIVVVPPYALSRSRQEATQVDADDMVVTLTRYLAGFQLSSQTDTASQTTASALASVDRIIFIDPAGGTPTVHRPNGAHLFVNMEEEYATAKAELDTLLARDALAPAAGASPAQTAARHKANLDTVRRALALLPPTASALLTTPAEAANLASLYTGTTDETDHVFGYVGSVGTRRSQNPLIHNLITDRPVFSSSLPLGRMKPRSKHSSWFAAPGPAKTKTRADDAPLSKTTLLKRGMPLSIFPDPRQAPWTPPVPGGPRLRLTDTCIDLPRLVHLIEDSFGRRLDVDDYLRRVENSLAGVIVAGEYEGGAILTWERPFGLSEADAYDQGRLVPYLDKFAVLKRAQGAGGVADIVFTAMVQDCFPHGVCWRSRKDNPVNRWYFERSRGSWKLDGVNWTMFWTTPFDSLDVKGIWDYESVCRGVKPSWLDQKHILD